MSRQPKPSKNGNRMFEQSRGGAGDDAIDVAELPAKLLPAHVHMVVDKAGAELRWLVCDLKAVRNRPATNAPL